MVIIVFVIILWYLVQYMFCNYGISLQVLPSMTVVNENQF